MHLEWILLAEGVGTNATGSVSAISINSNVLATPSVPVSTKRVVIAHFVGEPGDSAHLAGRDVTVTARVLSPSGDAVLAHSATGKFVAPAWPELPSGLDIAVELPLRITEYGAHDIVISAQADDGTVMEGRIQLYVMEPPTAAR
ncbi:MAG TPA: hypothetical protein VMV92_03610 [Streptosporangiaceae bacterium]|nr:hypothetical protein [Streptosporangiaceae bacterium]